MSDIIRRDQVFTGRKLASLPKTQFSGLDFDNIIADITELVTENPEYNKNWDDFLSSNAGRLMIEFFAYIADQLSTRIDWIVNENFIGTATQKKSIIRLLKLIGYNLDLPKAAKVNVDIFFDRPVGNVEFSGTGIGESLDFFSLTAVGLDGIERKNFEAISFNEETQKYNYINSIIELETGSASQPSLDHTVSFYEGRTFVFDIEVSTNNNFTFQLPQFPVIQGSPRVYLLKPQNQEEELEQVLSFLDPIAQRENDGFGARNPIPYILNVLDQDIVEVEFGPTSLLSNVSRRPEVGNIIRVYYRVGGGESGNITRKSINTTRRLEFNNILTNISFINNSQGFGGEEGEDAAFASVFGPLQIKTVNKAVTEEDYDILLLGNINVIKSKSYGNNNLPPQFFQRYNVFMRPLEVWNYSILNKSGFTEVPPSRYDDFEWIQLRLENRFNQKHSFTKGKFNDAYTIFSSQIQRNLANEEINISEDESSIPKNFILINTNQDFKNSLNENFRLKATSKELSDNYFFLTKENNIFNKQVELKNTGEIDFSKNVNEIKQEEKAHYVSTVNLDDNFSISELPATPKNLKIGFDNREPIEIDLTEAIDSLAGEIPPKVTPEEISNYINEKFTESLDYNDSDLTEEFGRQKLGLNISDFEEVIASFLRNKNYYFKVNGIEFFINTGQEDVTYNILREKIDKSFGVEFKGNIFNGSNKVVITDGNFRKNFINKGAKVLSEVQTTTEEAPPINDLDIDEYNWITDEITLSGNSTATRTNHSFRVRTFCTICENGNDIEIRNLSKEPYGVVLLQESDRDPEEDLFTVLGVNLQEPINCRGVSGYNNLGIKGVITATRGFQAFEVTNDISAITGERKFNLEINNLDDYGELIEDITVNFGTGGKNLDFVRQEIISQLEESYIDYNDLEIPQLNVYDDLRIISKEKGDFSTIRILPPSTGSSLIPSLGGVENPVDGIDSPVLGLETGEYSFKINNHTYKIDINEEDTFEDLIDILNGNEYENPVLDYFTASIVFEEDNQKEWERDIRITNNFSDRVYIEDINFFQNLKTERLVNKYERIEQENWEEFGDIIGGGDYSAVSGTFSALKDEGQETYLYLRSPSIGRYNSIINFYPVSSRNATAGIFGIVSNEEEKNYGYRKLSVIRSEGNNFGNVIYENGSLNFFGSDVEQIFLNYIFDSINQITLGRFNTDNFEREDPSYREPALRLYNTVYNQQSKEIDYFNSNFILKYTKEETDEISIFSIENNWEQLTRVTPAEISSRENPQDFINSDFYLIKLNIDNIGDVEIDLSGDFGQNPGTYNLQDIVNIINNSLQQDSNYNFSVYSSFNFATIIENKIVIRSPISTSNSKVIFKKPSVEEADASNEIFFINYIDGEREIITTGDYYIIENRQTIKGNLTTETNVITGISSEDFEKIQVGDKIYEKLNTTRRCFVLSKSPENNSIKLSLPVLTTGNNIEFDFSNNLMMLNKIEKEESFVPDLDFYLHFINDRRYVEEIFGGEVIIDEDTGIPVKLPGNSLGSLDEDRLISFMNDKKIVSVENIFKQTKFRTFDIKANVYYNKAFSRDDVRQRVEKSLRDFYNLRNRNYAEGVSRSKIMSIIHDNFGVEFVEIEYLGYDATKPETSVENVLSPAFDEIIVLSENKSFGGRIIRGLIFNYLVENN